MKVHSKTVSKGFALIATISVLSLLVMIAIGMLSLSTVTKRSVDYEIPSEQAKANARMALMMALGELQKTTGPDTRITAPADVVEDSFPRQLTGVWRSWEGLDHDSDGGSSTAGLPTVPDYTIKEKNEDDGGRFLKWLISDESQVLTDPTSSPSLEKSNSTVALLSEGSLPSDSDEEVHIVPTAIRNDGGQGAYAWWVQGENTKARLKPSISPNDDLMAVAEQVAVSPGPSGDAFKVGEDATIITASNSHALIEKASTRATLDLLEDAVNSSGDQSSEFFHDISVHSKGLLVNVANGGWKRDLSIFSEFYEGGGSGGLPQISSVFPSFTLSPGEVFPAGNILYPWSLNSPNLSEFQNSVSWSALADFATQYKDIKSAGAPLVEMLEVTNRTHSKWKDEVQRIPVISRIHYVLSLSAREETTGSDMYLPCIVLNPVVTLWNPYNVALDMSSHQNMTSEFRQANPFNFTFEAGTAAATQSLGSIVARSGVSSIKAQIPLNSPPVWLPGEVRVFTPQNPNVVDRSRQNRGSSTVTFAAGYRNSAGLRYPVFSLPAMDKGNTFTVTAANVTKKFDGPNVSVIGWGLYFTNLRGDKEAGNSTNNIQNLIPTLAEAKKFIGESLTLTISEEGVALPSLDSLSTTSKPFVCVLTGLRFSRDLNDLDDVVVNGVHNMNPAIGYMTDHDGALTGQRMDPFPYDIQYFAVNSAGDPGMPGGLDDEFEGYMGTGYGSSDGLSNLVLLEIPTKPLRSIGDLQHFNVNACNSNAPFTLNALGNSRASPFIQSDQVMVPSPTDKTGFDHSYVFNHIMLDDWFVSTVAPDLSDWTSTESRGIEQVYADHLNGDEDLPNDYYKAIDGAENTGDFIARDDAWERIAAELEVEGMFNINSTSEKAWAMLLKRNFASGKATTLSLQGSLREPLTGNVEAEITLDSNDGSAFPRTLPESDEEGAGLNREEVLTKAARFSDVQIEALAREVVTEIKKRGPFLSLSEFFNRRLTTNDDELANAGAVESALNTLSLLNDSEENPYQSIQEVFQTNASLSDMLGDPLTYPFAKAAEGNAAYGYPGWTRQADVLRPISGILSARDDTFTIRAYGSAKDASGKVLAEAWCEAVVQRTGEFVEDDDKFTLPTDATHPLGRCYEIIQFRWLNQNEV
ncbi:hypothetical protein [Rubritalea sp.]|uniref:hypothetical protein n=1 Tax=Rubritalea sp. TaxID=2109375 RepID=UPI003EF0F486